MTMEIQPFTFGKDFAGTFTGMPSVEELGEQVARLEAAVELSFEQGRRVGAAEALAMLERSQSAALTAVGQALTSSLLNVENQLANLERAIASEASELAFHLAEQLAAHELAREPMQAITTALSQVIAGQASASLHLRVHPDLVDPLREWLAQEDGVQRPRSSPVMSDASLAPGDARIEWESGELHLSRDARLETLLTKIAEYRAA